MSHDIIWKYPLPIIPKDRFEIAMPCGGRILSLQLQSGVPTIWALVDHAAKKVDREFLTFGTGQPLDSNDFVPNWDVLEYVGTYPHSIFIWHVFVVKEQSTNEYLDCPKCHAIGVYPVGGINICRNCGGIVRLSKHL